MWPATAPKSGSWHNQRTPWGWGHLSRRGPSPAALSFLPTVGRDGEHSQQQQPRKQRSGPHRHPPDTVREVPDALVMFTCVGELWATACGLAAGLPAAEGPLGIYLLHLAVADLLFLICSGTLIILSASSWGPACTTGPSGGEEHFGTWPTRRA